MPVPVEPDAPDAWFDAWAHRMKFVGGIVLGAFLAGVFTLLWGDARYVRTSEYEKNSTTQAQLTRHEASDKAEFAPKTDLAALSDRLDKHIASPAHTKTAETNRAQDQRIARLEENQAWIAEVLFRLARRQGITISPPPLSGVPKALPSPPPSAED